MRIILYILIGFTIYGCSNQNTKEKEEPDEESLQMPGNLFAFHGIKSSLIVNDFWYDRENNFKLYSDSISKISFTKLDTFQMRQIIAPVVTSEMTMIDANYVTHLMEGQFISKQKNIGDFTPIIVFVSGDDYEALFYILLDKSLSPFSHYRMYGGLNAGPIEEFNSTIKLAPIKHTFINGDMLTSYTLTETMRPDKFPQLSIFDSVNYSSKILPSGHIETQKIDSFRFERKPN